MARGPNPKHTACRPGTTVIIKLIDGRVIVDRFVERKHGIIFLEKNGRIGKGEMRSFAVFKKRPPK